MTFRRLLAWCDLDDRRRRQAQSGLAAIPGWVYSATVGLLLLAEVARSQGVFGGADAGSSAGGGALVWLAAVIASHVVVLFSAPFRMFWRRDSTFLGRSAIPGKALFAVALVRNARAAALVAAPCALAALGFALGPAGSADVVIRHLAVVAFAALNAGLLGPAVALAAGAVVASDQAQSALSSIAGEYQAPRTSWLGVLPGFAGTGLALALIATAGWSRGADVTPVGDPLVILVPAFAIPVIAALLAHGRADRVMLAAMREVAALDQERLAHVELTGPSAIERALGGLLGAPGARLVHHKDASLARRRFPIPFFLGFAGLACSCILAAVQPGDLLLWAGVVSGGLGVYGVVMARRSTIPPIEQPRLLHALPVSRRAVLSAKRMRVTSWVLIYMVLGAIPVVLRSPDLAISAALLGAVSAATLAVGWTTARG